MPSHRQDRDEPTNPDRRDAERRRRRKDSETRRVKQGHQSTDSTGALLPPQDPGTNSEDERRRRRRQRRRESESAGTSSRGQTLSLSNLQSLEDHNRDSGWQTFGQARGNRVENQKEPSRDRRGDSSRKKRITRDGLYEAAETRRDEKRKSSRPERTRSEDYQGAERLRGGAGDSDDWRRSQRREESDRERKRRHGRTRPRVVEDSTSDRSDHDRSPQRRQTKTRQESARYTSADPLRVGKKSRRPSVYEEKPKIRIVSGQLLEKGTFDKELRRREEKDYDSTQSSSIADKFAWFHRNRHRWKRYSLYIGGALIALIIIVVIAVVVSSKNKNKSNDSDDDSTSTSRTSNLANLDPNSIPAADKGTYYDPFSWYDTKDFNVTYTKATVGGLPLIGLNSTWNDDVQANPSVPKLSDEWQYGSMPIRGINVGGWLSIEPFITPSFFNRFNSRDNIIDEWTFCSKLGSMQCKSTLEQHYSSFITKKTFTEIRAANFDHVRIPFSYWAVTTYDGDPYVSQVSWRYLLRAIEYSRQNGLRVNLDLHGLPGSQNGWNHSGRQGYVGWLNGTDGDLNGQRSLAIHDQLSQFFSQPRYRNIVTMYGLANEPRMTGLDTSKVLSWTQSAISKIRANNVTAIIVFGDGFMGLDNWQGKLQTDSRLLLDVHQYVIFNNDQMQLSHSDKLTFACKGWTQQMTRSMDKKTGFGPTICGEWSQADTDCAASLNNVNTGNRWEGTLNTGNLTTSVLTPQCPTKNNPKCSCTQANADPGSYSEAYRDWLMKFAVAQMDSFERGWGWFYWTWETESATQWSYRRGMAAGILPSDVRQRAFTCLNAVPDYGGMGLAETY